VEEGKGSKILFWSIVKGKKNEKKHQQYRAIIRGILNERGVMVKKNISSPWRH